MLKESKYINDSDDYLTIPRKYVKIGYYFQVNLLPICYQKPKIVKTEKYKSI